MRLYREGDQGEPVRDIQGRLSALGFETAPDVAATFGPATATAVSHFQRSKGLASDGIVGPDTWRVLVDAGYRLTDRLLYHTVPMIRGDDVADLQRQLNALGFDTGKVDGIFGPDTLRALLDFQHNRGMAEDGIAGREVAKELELMARATNKHGRDLVREREWIKALPHSVAGRRIYLDPSCRDDIESEETWRAAIASAEHLRGEGGHPILSREVDTAPTEQLRARRANRLDIDIVIAYALPTIEAPAVFFFASPHSRSAAGETIAAAIAFRLGVDINGRVNTMLRETRSPAVVVSATPMNEVLGRAVAEAVIGLYARSDE